MSPPGEGTEGAGVGVVEERRGGVGAGWGEGGSVGAER